MLTRKRHGIKKHIIMPLMAVALLAGCKTKERIVTVETVRTDTTYITRHERDSIHVHDSIHVSEKGDTVRIDRWHTQWRDRLVTDTVIHLVTDTVPKPYPVIQEKKVEKELTWWQRLRLTVGDIALFAIALMLVVWIVKSIVMKIVRP